MNKERQKIRSKSIFVDLILIFITFGFWNIWMQYRQIRDFNKISNYRYSFLKWFLFSLITFGIDHVYHEYKLTRGMIKEVEPDSDAQLIGLIAGAISATGLWIFVDIYQQDLLNQKST